MNKNLFSTTPYYPWVNLAKKNIPDAICNLELELLLSEKISHRNLIRLIWCCEQINNYDLAIEIIDSLGDIKIRDPFIYGIKFIKDFKKISYINNPSTKLLKISKFPKLSKLNIFLPLISKYSIIKDNKKESLRDNIDYLLPKFINNLKSEHITNFFSFISKYFFYNDEMENGILFLKKALDEDFSLDISKLYSDDSTKNFSFFSKLLKDHYLLPEIVCNKIYIYLTQCDINNKNYSSASNFISKVIDKYRDNPEYNAAIGVLNYIDNKFYTAYKHFLYIPLAYLEKHKDIYKVFLKLLINMGYYNYAIKYLKKNPNCLINGDKLIPYFIECVLKCNILSDTERKFQLKELLSKWYNFSYREGVGNKSNSNRLVIIISSFHSFMCYKNNLQANVLFIKDNFNSWYTIFPEFIIDNILKYISVKTEIVFLGVSRGAYAALSLSSLLSLKTKNKIYTIAISPQINIYPYTLNTRLSAPSYEFIYELNKDLPFITQQLKENGDIYKLLLKSDKNLQIFAYCGDKNNLDLKQLEYLSNLSNFYLCKLPDMELHNVLPYFYRDITYMETYLNNITPDHKLYKETVISLNYKKKFNYNFDDLINSAFESCLLKFYK